MVNEDGIGLKKQLLFGLANCVFYITSDLWSDGYHLNQQCMYNVRPFLCSPGQLGLGGGIALFSHCIHRIGAWLNIHL